LKKTLSKILLPIILVVITVVSVKSQTYDLGLGLRLGGLTSGFTLKSFIGDGVAIEGILGFGKNGFVVTGLYEQHNPLFSDAGLMWLYGVGGHVGFFRESGSYYTFRGNRVYNNTTVVGVDGILGLDYKFKNAPINIGVDIKPIIDFFGETTAFFDAALSLRLAL